MSRDILKTATFGILGSKLIGGSRKSSAGDTPAQTPNVMPTPDDDAVLRARKRAIAQRLSSGGRDSTILTGSRLGG